MHPPAPSPFPNLTPEFDLKLYVRILWQWLWLVLLCTIIAGATASGVSLFSIPIYQASSTILIDEARTLGASNYQDILFSERRARTYAEWMQRDDTMQKIAEHLAIDPAVLREGITEITVTPLRDTQLVRIAVEGIWPELVATVADTLPTVFVDEVVKRMQNDRYAELEINFQAQVDDLNSQIDLIQIKIDDIGESRTAEEEIELNRLRNELTQKQSSLSSVRENLESLQLTKVQTSDSIILVEGAKLPTQPIRPRILVNTLLAAIVGALLALGLVFLIEYLDDRIKTPQDLSLVMDVPVLGAITRLPQAGRKPLPPDQALITALQPRHPITEAYRSLRTNLRFSTVDVELDSLVVTSATPGEGKTTTTANLAVVLAQAGRKVVLIDADLRKPRQHLSFNLSRSPGLTNALMAGPTVAAWHYVRSTVVPNLYLLPSGESAPNPAELLGSQRMQQIMEQLHEEADLLLFDAPPLLPVTDAQVLAGLVRGVLLVVNMGQTKKLAVARAAEALARVNAHLFGVVLNGLSRAGASYGYYSGYGAYESYYAEDEPPTPSATAPASSPVAQRKGLVSMLRRTDETGYATVSVNGHHQTEEQPAKQG